MSDRRPANLPTPGAPPSGYRLSDVERDEAISALGDAYAEGRLDADEFQERMEVASLARFATDLDPLFADLPRRPGRRSDVQRQGRPTHAPASYQRGAPWMVLPMVFVVLFVIATHFWILLPILFILTRRSHHRAPRIGVRSPGHQCHRQGRGC